MSEVVDEEIIGIVGLGAVDDDCLQVFVPALRLAEEFAKSAFAVDRIDSEAIDELFGNIAQYAYDPATGPVTVRVEVAEDPMAVIITFIDNGKPYDPLSGEDPDITLSAEERKIGGVGVFLVKKTMDEITYEYKNGQNILKIRKNM